MNPSRRWTAGLLTAAFVLAGGTPAYLSWARPSVAPYLLHPWIFVLQLVPYVAAAALWVPRWAWVRGRRRVTLSALLLAAALVMYLPPVLTPERWGGDMIALAVLAASAVTTAFVLVASGLMALHSRWVRRADRGR